MNGLVTRRLFPSELKSVLRGFGGLHRDFNDQETEAVADWAPRVETYVKDEALHVRADLPGVDPKAVDISVEDDVLTIRGERKAEHESPAYREVSYGRFERRIRVPDGTEADKVTAKFTNGVLEIAVPLPKPVSRKVTINVASAAAA